MSNLRKVKKMLLTPKQKKDKEYPKVKSWWPGDSRVEKYMLPVKEAIKRHIQEQSAFTDIYNRCYEAIYKAICDKEK